MVYSTSMSFKADRTAKIILLPNILHFAVAHHITYFDDLLHLLLSKRKQIITKGDKCRYNFNSYETEQLVFVFFF